MLIDSDLIAPVYEEASKAFILYSFGPVSSIVYTIVFAFIEMIMYIVQIFTEYGHVTFNFVLARLMCIGVHLTCVTFQLIGFSCYIKNKNRIYSIAGYLAATSFHYLWNTGMGILIVKSVLPAGGLFD